MNEAEFIDSIDCAFPYHDEEKWRALITQGRAISANASFTVLFEVCRKPISVRISRQKRLAMVDAWSKENDHPLSPVMIEMAKTLVTRGNFALPVERGLEVGRTLARLLLDALGIDQEQRGPGSPIEGP